MKKSRWIHRGDTKEQTWTRPVRRWCWRTQKWYVI